MDCGGNGGNLVDDGYVQCAAKLADCELEAKHSNFVSERSIESYGLLDLYSHSAFLTVLNTPKIYDAFSAFLRSEHSTENLNFWSRCERYRGLNENLLQTIIKIKEVHLEECATEEINVAQHFRVEGIQHVTDTMRMLEEQRDVLDDLQREVQMLMWRDSYPRFLKHRLAYHASKSLEWDQVKTYSFKGLGECFCLTDPSYFPIRKPQKLMI